MKLTLESIQSINYFEKITGAKVKDCIYESETLTFLVEEGQVRKAMGKNNQNLKNAEFKFKKRIKIISYSKDPVKFIKNLLYPIRADNIEIDDKIIKIYAENTQVKGKIFGREKSNLKRIEGLMKKYFNIEKIQIV